MRTMRAKIADCDDAGKDLIAGGYEIKKIKPKEKQKPKAGGKANADA